MKKINHFTNILLVICMFLSILSFSSCSKNTEEDTLNHDAGVIDSTTVENLEDANSSVEQEQLDMTVSEETVPKIPNALAGKRYTQHSLKIEDESRIPNDSELKANPPYMEFFADGTGVFQMVHSEGVEYTGFTYTISKAENAEEKDTVTLVPSNKGPYPANTFLNGITEITLRFSARYETVTIESYATEEENAVIGWTIVTDRFDITSGPCGDNLLWTYDNADTITVSGTGDMWDYDGYAVENLPPWEDLCTARAPKEFILEDGITSIGDNAFGDRVHYMCYTTGTLFIPASVSKIGSLALADSRFDEFIVDENNKNYASNDGILYSKDFAHLIKCPITKESGITIPDSVTAIDDYAFFYCDYLTGTLTIPDSVTTIGKEAFYSCSGFTGSLTIPDSVTTIGDGAFAGCTGFTGTLNLPDSLSFIGKNAFYGCKGFGGELVIPAGVIEIGEGAFRGDFFIGLGSPFNEFIVDSDNSQFASLGGILYSKDLTRVLQCPASKTGKFAIPNSVTVIDDYAFSACHELVGPLILHDGVTEIGNAAFANCSGFTALTIPASVTTIDVRAFSYCKNIDTIIFEGHAPTFIIAEDVYNEPAPFEDVSATAYYPANDPTWTKDVLQGYGGSITWVAKWDDGNGQSPSGTDIIYAGQCGDNLTWTLDYAGTLTVSGTGDMWSYSFQNGNEWERYGAKVTKLVLEEGITSIGKFAFDACDGFTGTLSIPTSVTTIGEGAFRDCSGFTGSLTIPDGVTTIGAGAFQRCNALSGLLTIPDSVTEIGTIAFNIDGGFDTIIFNGKAPTLLDYENPDGSVLNGKVFSGMTATAYYPANDSTWTDAIRKKFDGNITWVAK